jgi:hypothetical protein
MSQEVSGLWDLGSHGIGGLKAFECLSRQPNLVINIVGTNDISRLPRLVRV